jgi:PIN domain nuclease of toxin-antitoxin system
MKILLDTHALIWVMNDDRRLGAEARRAVVDRSNAVFVSAASIWEASIKFRLGRFPEAEVLLDNPGRVLDSMGIDALPISLEHARMAGSTRGAHRDPFDRMLAAQARLEGMTLASADKVFDTLGIARLWR